MGRPLCIVRIGMVLARYLAVLLISLELVRRELSYMQPSAYDVGGRIVPLHSVRNFFQPIRGYLISREIVTSFENSHLTERRLNVP